MSFPLRPAAVGFSEQGKPSLRWNALQQAETCSAHLHHSGKSIGIPLYISRVGPVEGSLERRAAGEITHVHEEARNGSVQAAKRGGLLRDRGRAGEVRVIPGD